MHLGAVIERAEKQALLARQAQKLLELVDDSPIVPGESHEAFARGEEARVILTDAEAELKQWAPTWTLPQQSTIGPDGMAVQSPTSISGESTQKSADDLYSDPRTEGSVADTATVSETPATVGTTTKSEVAA